MVKYFLYLLSSAIMLTGVGLYGSSRLSTVDQDQTLVKPIQSKPVHHQTAKKNIHNRNIAKKSVHNQNKDIVKKKQIAHNTHKKISNTPMSSDTIGF